MIERRTSLIACVTFCALLVVALLGWRSYASIRVDESLRLARRQQVLAGTIAIAIASEVGSWRTQLQQLNRLPSAQYVTGDLLALRLNDLFPDRPGALLEVVRTSPEGGLSAWLPASTTLVSESPIRAALDQGLVAWSQLPSSRDATTSVLLTAADGTTDLVLATPTYHTALGSEDYRNPSGAYAGLLAFRLDLDRLVSPYLTHVLETSPESTASLLVAPGLATYWRLGTGTQREPPRIPPDLWLDLLRQGQGSNERLDEHGHSTIASWATVDGPPAPLLVWLDQSSEVAQQAVWPVLLRQAPMFALLVGCVLTLGWALQRSYRTEDRYRALVTHAADGIVVLSPDGTIIDVNPAGTRLLGVSASEAVGQAFGTLLEPGQRGAWSSAVGDVRDGVAKSLDSVVVRGDREQTAVAISLAPVSPGRLLAIVRDISRRRALELQLRHAQKMEAVGRLAGGIAHDFNNLLTAILGYNELLLNQLPPDDVRRGDAVELGRAAERAADLTRRLLAFGRRQLLEPRVLDLNDLIQGIDALLRRLVGTPVTIELDLAPDMWRVAADPGQLEQVLINLAVNGRDAMPTGGTLWISTANVTMSSDEALALGLAPGDYVALAVTDNGEGIPDHVRPHLFEPFFTTKPVGSGTGLGLPTVYGIVQQSGGAIQVESQAGHGATLRILLPRTLAPLPPAASTAASAGAVARGQTTVLLVEDEPAVRALLSEGLSSHGYTVLAAADPLGALELFNREGVAIGALLSDVVMPHMSGPVLAHRLRAVRGDLPVVLMSGYAIDVFEREPPPEGAILLQKPLTSDDVARALATLLRPA